jgi:hypothetical protein
MKEPKISRWEECIGKTAIGVSVEEDDHLIVAWNDGTYSSVDKYSDFDYGGFHVGKTHDNAYSFIRMNLLEAGAVDREWTVADDERLAGESRLAIETAAAKQQAADLKKYNELKLKLGL